MGRSIFQCYTDWNSSVATCIGCVKALMRENHYPNNILVFNLDTWDQYYNHSYNIFYHTPLMQWLEVIIARLDHHGEYRWINLPRYVGTWFAPPSITDFLGKVGLNLAFGLVTSCYSRQTAWWRCYSHQTAWWNPVCYWLGCWFMMIGDPSKSH